MLFLVRPTFISRILPENYATINSVESYETGTIGTVLNQGTLNDVIIDIFKKKFPNPKIVFKRLKETEFYTISLANESDIDFAELEKNHDIKPDLTLRFNDSVSGEVSSIEVNKILFNLNTTIPNYTPFTDKELYENGGANTQEMIQNGKKMSGVKLNNLNLNNTTYPGVNFAGSEMNDSQFVNATLIAADFADAELNNANFNNADLRGSDFSVSTITGKASFVGADLKFANFSGSDLTGADLRNADLRHTNLSAVTLTDCIINENTKIYGAIIDDDNYRENLIEANRVRDEDDIAYEASGVPYELEEEEEIDYSAEDELVEKVEQFNQLQAKEGSEEEENILPPLVIDKTEQINDRYEQPYTFENIVSLLSPKITNVKIPLSQMEFNKWYGIASLGNTDPSIWAQVGVNEPRIGTVFKSISVPNPESGEAIVYETVAACMAVHELSRRLDISNLFKTFKDSVDGEVFSQELDRLTRRGLISEQDQLEKFAIMLYNLLFYLLSKHNDDETSDSWTHIYDDIEKRKQFISHAVFNSEEGIMYHPRFDYRDENSFREDILLLIMFIESLPPQIQVAWAQNYIKEFIEGYGQQLETFDRTKRSDMGFIASCLNGNLEKMLLSIRTAIVQFYPLELAEETEEETLENLKSAVTGSEFQRYFATVEDINGPTLEGYKNYIQTNPEFNNNEKLREKYLELLEDPEVIDKIRETIEIMSGGKKRKQIKRKSNTMKRKSNTIKRRKTIKRKSNTKVIKKSIKKKVKTYNHKKNKHTHKIYNKNKINKNKIKENKTNKNIKKSI
jgi:hypothetical protein